MSTPPPTAPAADDALVVDYDVAMLDLDGVVYIGGEAVAGAADHLAAARAAGQRLAFITNNASRTPQAVADLLTSLGVPASTPDVVTSAQAAARVLVDRLGRGANVVMLGGDGLRTALQDVGLRPVGAEDDTEAAALVTGYGPKVRWAEVMRAATRIAAGLWWVATNTDATIPTPYGVAPGHGVLVDTIRRFTGVAPVVAGKPSPPLLEETIRRMAPDRPLMVGDRLDTDIAGARAVGLDSLLVMTGVSGLADLCAATPEQRPTYVAADLGGLLEAPTPAVREGDDWRLGGWQVTHCGGDWSVSGQGSSSHWWRVVAAYAWDRLDRCGEEVDPGRAQPPDPAPTDR